jgi:hypothetical protein
VEEVLDTVMQGKQLEGVKWEGDVCHDNGLGVGYADRKVLH